jgi:hypothetical protein
MVGRVYPIHVLLRVFINHLRNFTNALLASSIQIIRVAEVSLHLEVHEKLLAPHFVLEVIHYEATLHRNLMSLMPLKVGARLVILYLCQDFIL